MIYQMFAVFDKAVGAYNVPLFFRSKGEAVRSFSEAVNDEKSNLNKHASDYYFAFVGEFDDGNGLIVCPADPVRIISAVECLVDDTLLPPKSVPEPRRMM